MQVLHRGTAVVKFDDITKNVAYPAPGPCISRRICPLLLRVPGDTQHGQEEFITSLGHEGLISSPSPRRSPDSTQHGLGGFITSFILGHTSLHFRTVGVYNCMWL